MSKKICPIIKLSMLGFLLLTLLACPSSASRMPIPGKENPVIKPEKPAKEYTKEDWGDAWSEPTPGVWVGGIKIDAAETPAGGDFRLKLNRVEVDTRGVASVQILGGSGKFTVSSSDNSKATANLVSVGGIHVVNIQGQGVYNATITVTDTEPRADGSLNKQEIDVDIVPRDYGTLAGLDRIALLEDEVSASSGLIYSDGNLYTIIDSSNQRFVENKLKRYASKPILYKLDKKGKIVQRITITGVSNTDWEDLAADKDYIYIADTGYKKLNSDNPSDYSIGPAANKVYRISKQAIKDAGKGSKISVPVDKVISLNISGRPNSFSSQKDCGSDWDFEALSVKDNQLILFSKQWSNNAQTNSFSHSGAIGASLRMDKKKTFSLSPRFMVTGSTYDAQNDVMILVGYRGEILAYDLGIKSEVPVPQRAYIAFISGYSKNQKLKVYDLGKELTTKQQRNSVTVDKTLGYEVEGVCIDDEGNIYITNETTNRVDGKLGIYYTSFVPPVLHKLRFR